LLDKAFGIRRGFNAVLFVASPTRVAVRFGVGGKPGEKRCCGFSVHLESE
jgi:hypothetical protein